MNYLYSWRDLNLLTKLNQVWVCQGFWVRLRRSLDLEERSNNLLTQHTITLRSLSMIVNHCLPLVDPRSERLIVACTPDVLSLSCTVHISVRKSGLAAVGLANSVTTCTILNILLTAFLWVDYLIYHHFKFSTRMCLIPFPMKSFMIKISSDISSTNCWQRATFRRQFHC